MGEMEAWVSKEIAYVQKPMTIGGKLAELNFTNTLQSDVIGDFISCQLLVYQYMYNFVSNYRHGYAIYNIGCVSQEMPDFAASLLGLNLNWNQLMSGTGIDKEKRNCSGLLL